MLAVAAGTAVVAACFQRPVGEARWESDNVRSFDGFVAARPYAMLLAPGEKAGDPPRTLLLVEGGKFGALARVERLLAGADSMPARVRGTLLHRDGRLMLELAEGEAGLRRLDADETRQLSPLAWPDADAPGEVVTLAGEVIDPKCYLGAMRPGGGKTHKACAMLCVSGGVPPMLVTRDAGGRETYYLLVTDQGGAANQAVLPFVGDAVAVSGRLERRGDLLVMKVRASDIRRR